MLLKCRRSLNSLCSMHLHHLAHPFLHPLAIFHGFIDPTPTRQTEAFSPSDQGAPTVLSISSLSARPQPHGRAARPATGSIDYPSAPGAQGCSLNQALTLHEIERSIKSSSSGRTPHWTDCTFHSDQSDTEVHRCCGLLESNTRIRARIV